MNKAKIMGQPSIQVLLEELIKFQPGITSQRLWETAKEWYGNNVDRSTAMEFDVALMSLRDRYRCTDKRWYPKGFEAPPKVATGPNPDPRQIRMDW